MKYAGGLVLAAIVALAVWGLSGKNPVSVKENTPGSQAGNAQSSDGANAIASKKEVSAAPAAGSPGGAASISTSSANTSDAAPAARTEGVRREEYAQGISPDANANVRSVVEAAKTGKYPERLTAMIMPKTFDKAAFEANPQAYLDVVEPGRIWQTASGGPNVKTLDAKGPAFLDCPKHGSVTLTVLGEKFAPVTFTSLDMGAFQNRLTSVTVRADEKGEASVVFTATPGTVEGVRIIAASPLAVGQVNFKLTVKE